MLFSYNINNIPKELIDIILKYDGRIKYRKGIYVDVIHRNDFRYSLLHQIIFKKIEIMKNIELCDNSGFYFEFNFDSINNVGLVYDYNFSFKNKFEICYYDTRDGWEQIRTYI
jgi:hypothetical protein